MAWRITIEHIKISLKNAQPARKAEEKLLEFQNQDK